MRRFLLLLVAMLALGWSGSALAAKAPMIFNTGDEMFEVADLPESFKAGVDDPVNTKVGYFCQHFGIFWADVWTWDCKIALVNQEASTYYDLPDELAAELGSKYPLSDIKRSFWNKFGIWLMLAGLVGLYIYGRRNSRDDDEDTEDGETAEAKA